MLLLNNYKTLFEHLRSLMFKHVLFILCLLTHECSLTTAK